MRVWLALGLLAALCVPARSILRGGLWDIQLESGRQERMAPNWVREGPEDDPLNSWWEESPTWTPGRTWTLGAGVFLNDNFRVGMRLGTVTAHGNSPSLDSLLISLETAFFTHPEGPLSASLALRAGLAPGFPRRDPPDNLPLYGIDMPPRVYGLAAGIRWIPLANLAIDCDLASVELWAGSVRDVWHVSWLTPRLSFLF
jgi:hypothetical protein